jgi:hypothetical protein
MSLSLYKVANDYKQALDELNEKLISKQLKIESIKRYLLTTLKDCDINTARLLQRDCYQQT